MYNFPIENRYDKYTFSELNLSINSKSEKDDIQLASIMAQMAKVTTTFFLDENINNWYRYKYSELDNTPFKHFQVEVNFCKKYEKNELTNGVKIIYN